MAAILGKKLGMTQIFTDDGDRVPVTVVEAGPCTVTQIKTVPADGYTALQIGFGEIKERRVNQPLAGHFRKAGVAPVRHLAEIRVEDLDEAAAWVKPPVEEEQKQAKAQKKAKARAKKEEARAAETEEPAEAKAAAGEPVEGEAGEAGEEIATREEAAAEEAPAGKPQPEAEAPGGVRAGGRITVEAFETGAVVKVSGISKGKGFAGVIKRHGFSGGPGSHGAHFHRAPGSVGASAYPSRVFKGLRLPGHMGARRATQRGLTVVGSDPDNNLLFIKGAVPGSKNGIVFIQSDS